MRTPCLIFTILVGLVLNALSQVMVHPRMTDAHASRGIIFEEDFNGLTALPPTWTVYAQDGWDMILAQNDEVVFFKQSTGLKTLILSTPLIDLTNASQLTFRFRSGTVISTLKVGLMTDPTNPNTFQLLTQFQADTAMITYTVPIGGVTGSSYISFNWVGTYFKAAYLDDVIVYDDALQNNVPSNVSDALLTPGPDGVSAGTLSWINPSQEADGDPLTDLDSVSVRLNGNYYATVLNPPIGANQSLPFNVPVPGMYTATLIPYNSEGEGIPNTTQEVWIGLDIPGPPTNVVLSQVGNLATLRWSPPKTGLHGMYFNGIVSNYVVRRADGWVISVPGADSSLIMDIIDPGTFNFKVIAENTSGTGPEGTSNTGVFLFGNYLLWEDFWVEVPAHLWTIQGENYYNWWQSNSNAAGGTAPELYFQSTDPYFNAFSRMVSPPLNTTGKSALTLEFRHAHTAYGPYLLKLETSSDDGATWHTGLSIPISATTAGEEKTVVLTTGDVGSSNFRFAFTFEGTEANLESFSIDNVRLAPTTGIDVAANAILLPDIIRPADVVVPKTIVQNLGVNEVSYKTFCTIRSMSGVIYSDSLSATIAQGATDTLLFPSLVAPEGELSAEAIIRCLSDDNPGNDTAMLHFVSYKTYPRTLVILEDATGTWCTYCPGASMGIEDLISHGMAIAAIGYHGGDPYETPESRARINYYPAITGFPTVMFDGVLSYVGGHHSTSMYQNYLPLVQQRLEKPTPLKVSLGPIQVEGDNLTAQVTVESLSPVRNSDLVIHAVLTESAIPEAWQDQSELNDVERMMFADSTGTMIDLSDKTESLGLQFALNSAWEKENLQLVVFIQDKLTREILDGDVQKTSIGISEAGLSGMRLYPNPVSDALCFPALKDATIHVYSMTGLIMMSATRAGGFYKLDVSSLENGLYLVRVMDQGKVYSSKIKVNH